MRIGARRLPRRRDPRRRFRTRLLLGMVGVALLPLVAFAVLAVFELDTIAKSTANATETAILQRQQANAGAALDGSATSLDRTMSSIGLSLQEGLTGALVKGLGAPLPAARAKATVPPSTYDVAPADLTADARFAGATEASSVTQEVALVLKTYPAINAVWFEDKSTGALRIYPAVTSAAVLAANGYATSDPEARGGVNVLADSEGGLSAATEPNAWVE